MFVWFYEHNKHGFFNILIIGGHLLYRRLSSNAIAFLPDGVFATMTKLQYLYVKKVFIVLVMFKIKR